MTGFLQIIGIKGILNLFLTLFPIIANLVKVAEAKRPEAGSGAGKFNEVMDKATTVALALPEVVNAVHQTGANITDAFHTGDIEKLQSSIGAVINVAVKLANDVGAFQKSGFVQAVTKSETFPKSGD